MYTLKDNCQMQIIPNMKGGVGEFILQHLLEEKDFGGKGRIFAKGTLSPGSTVGMHTHKGDMEVCFFLEGTGLIKDNGDIHIINPGDVNICKNGESHEIINNSDKNLVYIVLVLYTD